VKKEVMMRVEIECMNSMTDIIMVLIINYKNNELFDRKYSDWFPEHASQLGRKIVPQAGLRGDQIANLLNVKVLKNIAF